MHRLICFLMAALGLNAQGTQPKPKAQDYPASVPLGKLTLAADNMIHSVPTSKGVYLVDDYLVIDTAVYGPLAPKVSFAGSQFQLRINGSKHPILASPSNFATASIQNADWNDRPRLTAEAGTGDGGIILNGPRQSPRFPGDPTGRPLPPSPVPSTSPDQVPKAAPVSIADLVEQAAFPEGEHAPPFSGVLFFPYSGKIKSIKSLELLYEGPLGSAVVKLQ
jgi:hypothetical protein